MVMSKCDHLLIDKDGICVTCGVDVTIEFDEDEATNGEEITN